jgi:uncharacterized integral membrane protein
MLQAMEPMVYQGQFGDFTVTERDRQSVIIYRAGLAIAALCFAVATGLVLWPGENALALQLVTPLYSIFCLALGVSLLMIHIYLELLHRVLQGFWIVGAISAIWIGHSAPEPFAVTLYTQPLSILGIGFTFAALTGIFFKEGFCFNRIETKILTPIVPLLLLGHLLGGLPLAVEQGLLVTWAVFFLVFAIRKVIQPIPPDIGDKSVFDYLHQQKLDKVSADKTGHGKEL